jgi:hypothetical protein
MRSSALPADGPDRREFLIRTAAALASGALATRHAAAASEAPAAEAASLPTIALGSHRVTRLVVGSNPIAGYSYLGRETDQQMREYFTPERTAAFLQDCVRAGIDTHQYSTAAEATGAYRLAGQRGLKPQMLALLSSREDIRPAIESARPIAAAHHGGVTDRLFRQGKSSQVHDFVKAVHDAGLAAGVSAHDPDCIRRIADAGWPVDFFMTCFYYLTRPAPPEGAEVPSLLDGPDVGYKFYRDDPVRMCEVIRQVKQPCLAFKILGAGRRCADQQTVRDAFRFAFENIKPGDAVIVGMYPRQLDQVGANARFARELAAAGRNPPAQSQENEP